MYRILEYSLKLVSNNNCSWWVETVCAWIIYNLRWSKTSKMHRQCNGLRARLECGRS